MVRRSGEDLKYQTFDPENKFGFYRQHNSEGFRDDDLSRFIREKHLKFIEDANELHDAHYGGVAANTEEFAKLWNDQFALNNRATIYGLFDENIMSSENAPENNKIEVDDSVESIERNLNEFVEYILRPPLSKEAEEQFQEKQKKIHEQSKKPMPKIRVFCGGDDDDLSGAKNVNLVFGQNVSEPKSTFFMSGMKVEMVNLKYGREKFEGEVGTLLKKNLYGGWTVQTDCGNKLHLEDENLLHLTPEKAKQYDAQNCFCVGELVQVHNLTAFTSLNGTVGTIVKKHGAGTFKVRIHDGSKSWMQIEVKNLKKFDFEANQKAVIVGHANKSLNGKLVTLLSKDVIKNRWERWEAKLASGRSTKNVRLEPVNLQLVNTKEISTNGKETTGEQESSGEKKDEFNSDRNRLGSMNFPIKIDSDAQIVIQSEPEEAKIVTAAPKRPAMNAGRKKNKRGRRKL